MKPWQVVLVAIVVGLLGFIAGTQLAQTQAGVVARASNADGPASLGALYVLRPNGDVYGIARGDIYRIGNLQEDAQPLE